MTTSDITAPRRGIYPRPSPESLFWPRVVVADDGCWNWVGDLTINGYGRFMAHGKKIMSHRFSWEIHCGKIPDELLICHHCDNRRCVNPHHLFVGTHQDNMDDCVAKGRHHNAKKTHCIRGHSYDYLRKDGRRDCSVCRRMVRKPQTKGGVPFPTFKVHPLLPKEGAKG